MLSISAVKLGNIAQKTITFKIYTTDVRNMFHLSDCYFDNKDSNE